MMKQERVDKAGSAYGRFGAVVMVLAMLLTAMTLLAAPPADARPGLCEGDQASTLSSARDNYRRDCGEQWDARSGQHRCDWSPGGWTCNGPGRATQTCYSDFFGSIKDAKKDYSQECGVRWQHDSGVHKCVWSSAGWRCSGPGRPSLA